jgi:hypothetical protein
VDGSRLNGRIVRLERNGGPLDGAAFQEYVRELGPVLHWLEESGLTAGEAMERGLVIPPELGVLVTLEQIDEAMRRVDEYRRRRRGNGDS